MKQLQCSYRIDWKVAKQYLAAVIVVVNCLSRLMGLLEPLIVSAISG